MKCIYFIQSNCFNPSLNFNLFSTFYETGTCKKTNNLQVRSTGLLLKRYCFGVLFWQSFKYYVNSSQSFPLAPIDMMPYRINVYNCHWNCVLICYKKQAHFIYFWKCRDVSFSRNSQGLPYT